MITGIWALSANPILMWTTQKVFCITDTGRKWNNEAASIRDKVKSGFDIPIKISGKDAKTPE